ncbi:hypothetical protein CRI93_00890 [Longimonas halophila]|uniref:Uncharacterized protein n=1 Tax=Longimonas halophila TaxID=1469170 RepID=A0A2H3NQ46_9BACT|nr:hypothetical protein [Longimonas halophila]PEN09317.1 hypothetical protein CRI93_00890 [Longimonas halophila]
MPSSDPEAAPPSDPAPEGPESESSAHVFRFSVWFKLFGYIIAALGVFGLWVGVTEKHGISLIFFVLGNVLVIGGGLFIFPSYRVIITDAWIRRTWRIGIGSFTLYENDHCIPWEQVDDIRYSTITGLDPYYTAFVRGTRIENGRSIRQGVSVMMFMTNRKEALRLVYKYAPDEVISDSPRFQEYIRRIGA